MFYTGLRCSCKGSWHRGAQRGWRRSWCGSSLRHQNYRIGEVHAKVERYFPLPTSYPPLPHESNQLKFHSYCGGLPALECSNDSLGFKFSWSPRGAILSQRNSASFILDGQQVDIAAEDLMATAKPYFFMDGYDFVAYANRNLVPFREYYKIPESRTVVRGSLRYDENPIFIKAFADIGWLDATEKGWLSEGLTWAQIHARITGAKDSSETFVSWLTILRNN